MADIMVSPVVVPTVESKSPVKVAVPKKATAPKAKKSSIENKSRPSTAMMVKMAIKTLAERNGSSLQAIKKYIATTYLVDADKHAQFIKKFLKSAVADGSLIQVKGKGANGSFKLAVLKPITKPKIKSTAEKKTVTAKKPAVKKSTEKKTGKATKVPKKTTAPKKVAKINGEKIAKVAKPKPTVSKTKKATKAPTAKPKAPKPKKVSGPKSVKATTKATTAKK